MSKFLLSTFVTERVLQPSTAGSRHTLLGLGVPLGAIRQARAVAAAAAKKNKPQKKRLRKLKAPLQERLYDGYDEDDDTGYESSSVVVAPGARVPGAPPPSLQPNDAPPQPQDLYPVFPARQAAVSRLSSSGGGGGGSGGGGSKWSWGGDAPASQAAQQDVPMWNPKTGFMRTRAEVEQAAQVGAGGNSSSNAAVVNSSSSRALQQGPSTNRSSTSSSSSSKWVEPLPSANMPTQQHQLPHAANTGAAANDQRLPALSREQVLGPCAVTSAGMTVAAVLLRWFAQQQAAGLLGTDQAQVDQLLQLPTHLNTAQEVGCLFGAAAAVTGARILLLQQWQDFADASDRSNKQVLSPLRWPDIVLVAALTGVTEELLFRGGLIPATFPDYRGVLLSGLVFGLLHNSGGRNLAFAAWAIVVGWFYGAAFLCTGNIWVAAGAHSLANFASAASWIAKNTENSNVKE